jgi:hypothetical protein
MTRKNYAFLVKTISVVFLALFLGACSGESNNNGGRTPIPTPDIESILNLADPGHSVRIRDWCLIEGSSFGESQDGSSVNFFDGTLNIKAAAYYLWQDDAVICQVPSGFSDTGVVGEELAVTVMKSALVLSNQILIPFDENPNPGPTPVPPLISKRPYIIYENNETKMKIAWQTFATPDSAVIKWGTTDACADGQAVVTENKSGANEHQFFYSISGLTADTLYYYNVLINGEELYVYPPTFRTALHHSATALTFYGYGDTRDGMGHMNNVLSWLNYDVAQDPSHRQTFCLHNGDFVHRGLTESYWNTQYFNPEYPDTMDFLSMMPVIASIGNHETYKQGDSNVPKSDYGKLFRKYFPYPMYTTDDFYYSFDYGPLHVACIDPYKAEITSGSPQLTWLNEDLASSTKPWKIVMVHPPLYSGNKPDSQTDKLRENIEPVIRNHNIKLVVQGHQHYYSRSEKDGVTYLLLGGGGGPLIKPDSSMPYYIFGKSCYHFARFEISGSDLNITVIDDRGDLVEQVPTIHN